MHSFGSKCATVTDLEGGEIVASNGHLYPFMTALMGRGWSARGYVDPTDPFRRNALFRRGGEKQKPPSGFEPIPSGGVYRVDHPTRNNMDDYMPAYPSNGKKIAYAGSDGHDLEIYTVNVGGGGQGQSY